MTPQGWQEKTLDEVCSFSRGLTYSKNDEVEFSDNIVLRANNIDLVSNSLNFDELKYITSTFAIPEDKKVKENSIMICISSGSKSHLGKVAFIDRDYGYAFGGFMGLMTPKENINPKYLYYMLITPSFKDLILHLTDGANINNLKYNDLKNFKLNIPPLPEQQRIVAKLDKAFEAIDKAKTIAETNLKNAKELFESALNNVFTKNTDGWEEKKLDDVCTYKSGTTISKDLEKDTGDLLYIKVGDMNIRGNEELITTSTRFASSAEISAAQIIPTGSVIFPKRGGAIATNKKRKIIKPTIVDLNTMAIIPNKELDSNFFYYWFGQINLIDISNGTTIPQINNYSFQNLRIKYPTLLEQQKIVEQLDKIQEKTKKLEAIYTQKIKECDELKQSILQKAFRGEL